MKAWSPLLAAVSLTMLLALPRTAAAASDAASDAALTEDSQPASPTPAAAEPAAVEEEVIEEVAIEETTQPAEVSPWDAEAWADGRAFPQFDRTVNLYAATPVRAGHGQLTIDHRANEPFADHAWRNFLGLDAGALKIGLGLRYGLLEDVDVGVARLNGTAEVFDTYELDARYRFLRQDELFLNAAARLGVSWFFVPDAGDALYPFGQLILDRTFARRVLVGASLLYHMDSSGPVKLAEDTAWSLAVALRLDVRLASFMAWVTEAAQTIGGYGASQPAWSTALKLITWKHTFSLIVTNNQYILADGVVANSPRELADLIVGFTITREMPLGDG